MSKKHLIKVKFIPTENPAKVYLVKRYSNGTYFINTLIKGKQFYRQWTRVKRHYANYLEEDFYRRKKESYEIVTKNFKISKWS